MTRRIRPDSRDLKSNTGRRIAQAEPANRPKVQGIRPEHAKAAPREKVQGRRYDKAGFRDLLGEEIARQKKRGL